MQDLIVLELNEVTLPYVEHYVRQGRLPAFRTLLERHGYGVTESESTYSNLEPWIQWVSAHTGLTFDAHKIFRLGDIVGAPVRQVFELLEENGVTVGAVSPMNAENRLKNPAFFIPDPWTRGTVAGSHDLQRLYQAICNGVNENAEGKLAAWDMFHLIEGVVRHGSLSSVASYLKLAATSVGRPWRRALFLDLLLADVFLDLWKRSRPQFAMLFLNAAAHIQHHYLYSSQSYAGPNENPTWYVPQGSDPLLEVYELYDSVLARFASLDMSPRLVIATGLSQEPYPSPVYYYRIKDHADFLKQLHIKYLAVQARMSRDFLVEFQSREEASTARKVLESVLDASANRLFEVDDRGISLFVTLTYENEIVPGTSIVFSGGEIADMSKHVAFVALKNGHHASTGYIIDTQSTGQSHAVPVTQIFVRILTHFGIHHQEDLAASGLTT
jgi:hypothetical protein